MEERAKHFGLFPKTLGQIIGRFGVQELHLALTQVLTFEMRRMGVCSRKACLIVGPLGLFVVGIAAATSSSRRRVMVMADALRGAQVQYSMAR